MNIDTIRAVFDDNLHLSTRALEALQHIPRTINPLYSHKDAGDGACGFNPDTTYAHKRSNTNPRRESFKILVSRFRRFNFESSGEVQ